MKTKILITSTIMILILSIISVVYSMDFSDVPEDFWAFKEIDDLTNTGIISGYPDGTYRLNGTIKKSEFLKLVFITCFPSEPTFLKEVKEGEHWAKYYFDYGKKYDLLDENWTLENLDDLITRIEMSRLVARAEIRVTSLSTGDGNDSKEMQELSNSFEKPSFTDINSLKIEDMALLAYNVKNQYLIGYDDGTFKPNKNMTRAETACVIYRLKGVVEPFVDYTPIKKSSSITPSKSQYTISYDANGGQGAPNSEKKKEGKEYIISGVVPTRDGYTFLGWNIDKTSNDVMYIGGDKYTKNANLKLYAVWQKNKEDGHESGDHGHGSGDIHPEVFFQIQFVNDDGTILQSGEVKEGVVPVYSGDTPIKESDAQHTYTFNGWMPEVVAATKDETYMATFIDETNKYLVVFKNEDGTILQSGEVAFGAIPEYTKETPTKQGNVEKRYVFNEWTPNIAPVSGDIIYTATFNEEANEYLVVFENDDGTVLQSGEVAYGVLPVYSGDTPTKSNDATYSYTFDKWIPVIAEVSGDATYTATYTSKFINAQYVSGDQFNSMIKKLATGSDSTTDTSNNNITSIQFQDTKPSDEILSSDNTINVGIESDELAPIYAWFDNGTIKLWSEAENVKMNDNSAFMFKKLQALESLNPLDDLGVSSTSNVTSMQSMFQFCVKIPSLDVSGFDTSNVTNMRGMFSSLDLVTTLDLSNFDTSQVTDMVGMFLWNPKLKTLNMSSFDTSQVTDMTGMFNYCAELTSVDISSFNTANVTNMEIMFANCEKLTSVIGITNLNTSGLKKTGGMFLTCRSLQQIDLSGWDTTSLETCNGGAESGSGNISFHPSGMFEDCSNLKQIDLSGWDTTHLTNTSYMFAFCHNLQKIYVSPSFITTNVTSDENMFKSDTTQHTSPSLKGGNGTEYSASHVDKEYACIDGVDGNVGYFWWHASYTLTFDSNGGSGDMDSIQINYGQVKILPNNIFTAEGKEFREWNTEADGSGDIYANKARVKNLTFVSGDTVTLYAQWDSLNNTTIIFDKNSDDATGTMDNQIINAGDTEALSPNEFEREDYRLVGWATLADGPVVYEDEEEYTAGLSDETIYLYAIWELYREIIPSIANIPILGEGMTAVYWDDDGDELTSSVFDAASYTDRGIEGIMYSYLAGDGKTDTKNSNWANAQTEDGSYWVWIPRFAYKITYTNDTYTEKSSTKSQYGFMDVLFMYGTSDDQYRDINGDPQDLPAGYKVHPAFQEMKSSDVDNLNQLGKWDEELEGIWVAKYEASKETYNDGESKWVAAEGENSLTVANSSRMVSKPSVISWRKISESNIYQNCLAMYEDLNSHEMKNSEWGAVAYLTYSPYGRNGNELAVNQCSSFYTGAGPNEGESTIYNGTPYAHDSSTFADTYAWNTEQGKLASTTGNLYGIYDMSGGAWEYVAGFVNNGHANITGYGGALGTVPETPTKDDLKTKQIYPSTVIDGSSAQQADYNLSKDIYGDAEYETSISYSFINSWCNDYSGFPNAHSPFFKHGGLYSNAGNAGVFACNFGNGGSNSNHGFRPVLAFTD